MEHLENTLEKMYKRYGATPFKGFFYIYVFGLIVMIITLILMYCLWIAYEILHVGWSQAFSDKHITLKTLWEFGKLFIYPWVSVSIIYFIATFLLNALTDGGLMRIEKKLVESFEKGWE